MSQLRRLQSAEERIAGKMPPQCIEAEEEVLGGILLDPNAIVRVQPILEAKDFYISGHQVLYQAFLDLYSQGKPTDLMSTTVHLKDKGLLEKAGGQSCLAQLVDRTVSAANADLMAQLILDKAIRRRLIQISQRNAELAYQTDIPLEEILDRSESRLFALSEHRDRSDALTSTSDVLLDTFKDIEDRASGLILPGISTGFYDLDAMTQGFQRSDLIIAAGRPSMGKCLAKGTQLILADGAIVPVEDVQVGDQLMGPDLKPRRVKSLARGCEKMVWIRQKKGMDYRCNLSHILSLKHISTQEVLNISVQDFLAKPEEYRAQYRGWKVNSSWMNSLTPFVIELDEVDDYYGFELEGDGLFLLEDGTVTHNTSFVLNIARNIAAFHKLPVAVYSLEMSKEQLVYRMLSSEVQIESGRLRAGRISQNEWEPLGHGISALSQLPIFIDDTPNITVTEMRSKARRLQAECGGALGLILIDYLQLMEGAGDNRVQELSKITRSLKGMARELNVPVVALSQLSRGVESRANKRPMMSDLRESGSIEQDADLIMMLYREEYYDPDTPDRGIAEVIITKHRNGPVGTVRLLFEPQYTLFKNLAHSRL